MGLKPDQRLENPYRRQRAAAVQPLDDQESGNRHNGCGRQDYHTKESTQSAGMPLYSHAPDSVKLRTWLAYKVAGGLNFLWLRLE